MIDLEAELERCVKIAHRNIAIFGARQPKIGHQADNTYELSDGTSWSDGYWPGILWSCYDYLDKKGDKRASDFLAAAQSQRASFEQRIKNVDSLDSDIGQLYVHSAAAEFDLTHNKTSRLLAEKAAHILESRALSSADIIPAWNTSPRYTPALNDQLKGMIIIDTLESLPLLYWCASAQNNKTLSTVALQHATTSATYLVREDGSTYHCFDFDHETGQPIGGHTWQGYADESCWSRGQGWAIHGFALAYAHSGDEYLLLAAKKTADYATKHLPGDYVPFWDYSLPTDAPQYKDSSAAAITAAGLLLLAQLSGQTTTIADRTGYRQTGLQILNSLAINYSTTGDSSAEGFLRQGTQNGKTGLHDTMLPYGDYFYLDALRQAIEC